jgi:hypothetical protein
VGNKYISSLNSPAQLSTPVKTPQLEHKRIAPRVLINNYPKILDKEVQFSGDVQPEKL